eukprot:5034445-Amphidinium_carterae.1
METVSDCAGVEEGHAEASAASQVVALSLPLVATNRRALVQSSHMQPRGCKMAQLVTEFAYKLWILCGALPLVGEKRRTIAPHASLPMGAWLQPGCFRVQHWVGGTDSFG